MESQFEGKGKPREVPEDRKITYPTSYGKEPKSINFPKGGEKKD
jgi:hypothetical protein